MSWLPRRHEQMRTRQSGGIGTGPLVVLFARPGTDARDKLDLLRIIGTQDLTAAPSAP